MPLHECRPRQYRRHHQHPRTARLGLRWAEVMAENVIFGTGLLGLAVARRLVSSRKAVRLVNRSGKAQGPPGAEVFAADATDSRGPGVPATIEWFSRRAREAGARFA